MPPEAEQRPVILVTGVAGNLGACLLRQLGRFDVIGVDMSEASPPGLLAYERLDLGKESSCAALVALMKRWDCSAVLHLAFVIDPVRTGVLDTARMWQINVAGTARMMEAITEVNRRGGKVRQFIFPSSVSAYGPRTNGPVTEEAPLIAHTLPYAVHKKEADIVVQERAATLGGCHAFILRPHIFAGATMQNYLVGALRGTPTGRGDLAARLRQRGTRLPMIVPFGERYPQNRFQFVHVDDMARLIVHILTHASGEAGQTILNVAGRGEPVTFTECAQIAHQKIWKLPGRWACRLALQLLWECKITAIPPDALPYIIGSYTMDITRLQRFLGKDFETVIRYTVTEALSDSFAGTAAVDAASA